MTRKLIDSDRSADGSPDSEFVEVESSGSSVSDCPGGSKRHRTRPDPLAGIWEVDVLPMLEATPHLRPVAIYEELLRRHPALSEGIRRTVERRVREWRLLHGPDREVVFRQVHEPGDLGMSDFTDMGRLGVTIAGQLFPHLLYHFRLVYSGFQHVKVVVGGESFLALSEGLQDALWTVGGVPRFHRTDSLSAAFRNVGKRTSEDMTLRYETFCGDLGMKPTRNNRGVAHENGSIEASHGQLKRAINDALELRGSRDFESLEAYQEFLTEIVRRRNARRIKRIEIEQKALSPLPAHRFPDFEDGKSVIVRSSGGFVYKKVFYSVPSRLMGHLLRVREYDDRLELFDGDSNLLTLPKGRCRKGGGRTHVVNYHHQIHSLRRKPMALLGLAYRDAMFPREAYRRTFELALERLSDSQACRLAVGLLALAHDQCCERELAEELEKLLSEDRLPDLEELQKRYLPSDGDVPAVEIRLPSLSEYDGPAGEEGESEDEGVSGDE